MNHSPYEEWLLNNPSLTPIQESELQQHLETCTACRSLSTAWQQVEPALRRVPPAEPQPGFTNRWLARLAIEKARLQRRQSLAILAFNVAGAFMLLGSLALLILPRLGSLQAFLWGGLYRLLAAVIEVANLGAFANGLAEAFTGGIPFIFLIPFVGLLTLLAVLWVVSFRLLFSPQRAPGRVSNEN